VFIDEIYQKYWGSQCILLPIAVSLKARKDFKDHIDGKARYKVDIDETFSVALKRLGVRLYQSIDHPLSDHLCKSLTDSVIWEEDHPRSHHEYDHSFTFFS